MEEARRVVHLGRADLEDARVAGGVVRHDRRVVLGGHRVQVQRPVLQGRFARGVLYEYVTRGDRVNRGVGEFAKGPLDVGDREDVGVNDHVLYPPSGDAAARVQLRDGERRAVQHLATVGRGRPGEWDDRTDDERPF